MPVKSEQNRLKENIYHGNFVHFSEPERNPLHFAGVGKSPFHSAGGVPGPMARKLESSEPLTMSCSASMQKPANLIPLSARLRKISNLRQLCPSQTRDKCRGSAWKPAVARVRPTYRNLVTSRMFKHTYDTHTRVLR